MVKRYNVKSEIDLSAWIEEQPGGVLVMANDYDDLRAQCGGMEMEIQELRQDLANLREGSNRLSAHKDAALTLDDINIATLECDNEALQAALRQIYEDIPSRPNMTEAGRVALMADIAGKAIGYPIDTLPESLCPECRRIAESRCGHATGSPAIKEVGK